MRRRFDDQTPSARRYTGGCLCDHDNWNWGQHLTLGHNKLDGRMIVFEKFAVESLALLMRTLRRKGLPFALAFASALVGCGGGSSPPLTPPSISIVTTSLANGAVGFHYSQIIQAQGGTSPFTWSVSAGSLPSGTAVGNESSSSVTISGTPDKVAIPATFTIRVIDAKKQTASQLYNVNIIAPRMATMQEVGELAPAGKIEIQGLSADVFNPEFWQRNALNWVSDVRAPMLGAQATGAYQNIYSPWPLEESSGWLLFYGGWDGTNTPNDRVYKTTTKDFLGFGGGPATGTTATPGGQLVIDHGAFTHVNNMSVQQLTDGSFHMICTTLVDANSLDKPSYFSSPDGLTWNGTPEPYEAQLSDVVSIPNDPTYAGYDFNGGNVLLRDGNTWALYYSVGIYGGVGQIYRATGDVPPMFQRTGIALATLHYANDVKVFNVNGKTWYLMSLYIERVSTDSSPVNFSYSLSTDGKQFGPEQILFALAPGAQDSFGVTPAFVTRAGHVLGVLYGANPQDLLSATDAIFARWLQKKVEVVDASGMTVGAQGGYGPDRQWFAADASGKLQGNMRVFAEDGVTPLATGSINLSAGKAYVLVLQ